MIAIVTPYFRDFYQFIKYSPFDGSYFEVKWVDQFKTVFGRDYDGYILYYKYWEIKEINDIVDYLESHGAKRINL